jgi:glycosyltransferase involved in cell wall biosynthesis
MNMERLLEDYTLVFEPSWSGYCHPDLLEYTRWNQEVVILAAEPNDFAFLTRLKSNLTPLELGPCDWVDPRVQTPYLDNPKEFDVVMNSNWAAWKRHHVLFRMLSKAKRRYNVLLIGVKLDGKVKADVEQLAQYFGVLDQLTILEDIPFATVMDMTCRARVSILLSLKEGGNRSIPESIFCNLPVIVLKNNVGGIRKRVVPATGLQIDEDDLEAAVEQLQHADLQPRQWGIDHMSCFRSTDRMNGFLRERALLRGEPWTMDIAGRSNSPESKYIEAADAERLAPFNAALKDYIR